MSARSSGRTPASAPPSSSMTPAAIRTCRGLEYFTRSIAAAAAAYDAGGTAGAFARLEHMFEVHGGNRVGVEGHDRIGQMFALVGLDPGLHGAAGRKRHHPGQHKPAAAGQANAQGPGGTRLIHG